MKITRIETIPFRLPYKSPLKWGLVGYLDSAENILVRVHTDEGITGIAEAVPRPTVYGETLASIHYAINNLFAPMLIGLDPAHTEKIWEKLDTIHWNPTAKGSIDLAIYDAVAKYRNVPLWEMLGGYSDRMPVGWVLSNNPIAEMIKEAEKIRALGIKAFKVKVGIEPQKDIQVISSLRENLGSDVLLYADANNAYMISTAITTIKKMDEGGLDCMEEPIARWDFKGLQRIAKVISIPLMGDESVTTPGEVARAIDVGAIDIIIIKTTRTGYTLSQKIATMAELSGVSILMGTQAESDIGALASVHFGAARRDVAYPSENSYFMNQQDNLLQEPIQIEDGMMVLPARLGNGVLIDENKLKMYRMD